MAELDVMEVLEDVTKPNSQESEFEVIRIASRKDGPDGEHLYEVYWKDNDITFEPVSNLSGAADALRAFLEASYPDDPLLKLLSSLAESDNEENVENGSNKANGVDKSTSFLARWHQKTTRGSTQYWLRKGDDKADTPSLLKRDLIKNAENTPATETVSDVTPLAPLSVPDTPEVAEVSPVLFSDEECTPASAKKVRKRIRIMEETVKMFPHQELNDLEVHQNRTLALWQEMLSGVLLVGICLCMFVYLYHHVYGTTTTATAAS